MERSPGYGVVADVAFEEVKVGDYDAVLLIGGRAPEYLRNRAAVIEIVQTLRAREVGVAICHGVQVLVTAGLVSGRKMTCYEHVKFELEQGGGKWLPEQAVRDGQYVTGQTWESHPGVLPGSDGVPAGVFSLNDPLVVFWGLVGELGMQCRDRNFRLVAFGRTVTAEVFRGREGKA